jgi:hypothetical protein
MPGLCYRHQSHCHGLSHCAELVVFGIVWFGCNTTMENDSLLLHNEKVEISQYTKQGFPYVCRALIARLRTEKSKYYTYTCHGLSTFLAELVAFDIGKVEISQYYLTRLRTEKSKYHNNFLPVEIQFCVNLFKSQIPKFNFINFRQ